MVAFPAKEGTIEQPRPVHPARIQNHNFPTSGTSYYLLTLSDPASYPHSHRLPNIMLPDTSGLPEPPPLQPPGSQLPPPVYHFRTGLYAGQTIDHVPSWYLQELMNGGDSGLVKRSDPLLFHELQRLQIPRPWWVTQPPVQQQQSQRTTEGSGSGSGSGLSRQAEPRYRVTPPHFTDAQRRELAGEQQEREERNSSFDIFNNTINRGDGARRNYNRLLAEDEHCSSEQAKESKRDKRARERREREKQFRARDAYFAKLNLTSDNGEVSNNKGKSAIHNNRTAVSSPPERQERQGWNTSFDIFNDTSDGSDTSTGYEKNDAKGDWDPDTAVPSRERELLDASLHYSELRESLVKDKLPALWDDYRPITPGEFSTIAPPATPRLTPATLPVSILMAPLGLRANLCGWKDNTDADVEMLKRVDSAMKL